MAKRTPQTGLPDWEETSDLEHVVKDKRSAWRGTPAKGRRRNRRYGNRILRSQSLEDELLEQDSAEFETRSERSLVNITEESDLDN